MLSVLEYKKYLRALAQRGYESYAEHFECDMKYQIKGSSEYWCLKHNKKVQPPDIN